MSEKRRVTLCLFITIMIVASSLWAQVLHDLGFTIGNDWHTPNIGYNYDDGLTYGVHIQFQFHPAIELNLDGVAFTDKKTTHTRYDILSLGASYPFTFTFDSFKLTLRPTLALLLGGQFEFRALQNGWHLLRRIPILRIDYSEVSPSFHILGGATVTGFWPIGFGGIELQGEGILAPTWINRLQATLAYYPDYATRVGVSYRLLDFADAYPNQRDHISRYQGTEISFTHQSGPLTEFFLLYPEEGIAYGSYIFNVFAFNEPKTFQHADWTYSFGLGIDQKIGRLQLFEVRWKNISLQARNANGSIKDSIGYEIARHQGGLYALAYRVGFGPFGIFTPYIKPYGGIQRFAYLEDQKPIFEKFLPTLGVEVGTQIGKPYIVGATAWRTVMGLSAHYPFGYQDIVTSIPPAYSRAQGALQVALLLKLEIDHDRGALARSKSRPNRILAPYIP